MLATWAEETLILWIKERLEHRNALLDDEIFLVFRGEFEHIHTDRMLDIGWVKIDNIVDALLWDALQ